MTDTDRAAANRKAREEKKKAFLQAAFSRHAERFRALEGRDAHDVARQVHATLDQVLERDRTKDRSNAEIKCRKGCDHCCKVPVEIFPHEAALLVRVAREAGIEMDGSRLERQSRYGIENWREQPASDLACVFLGEDGACRVYGWRPSACRKLLVVTAPALCDQTRHAADGVGRWISWEAEVLGAAALEVFGAVLMPSALLAALKAGRSG